VPLVGNPPLGFRFGVLFFAGGVIPTHSISSSRRCPGWAGTVETATVEEGGQNLYTQSLPKRISTRTWCCSAAWWSVRRWSSSST